jgi:hypothetical protein
LFLFQFKEESCNFKQTFVQLCILYSFFGTHLNFVLWKNKYSLPLAFQMEYISEEESNVDVVIKKFNAVLCLQRV